MENENEPTVDELSIDTNKIKKAIGPYQKPILYSCIIIFFILLLFVGFATGAAKVCNQMAGFLDNKFHCHPGYYNQTEELINNTNQTELDLDFGFKKRSWG